MSNTVLRVCFYGPESTGKSMMAEKMADLYQTQFVPEVSRELLTSNEFSEKDIIRVGEAQAKRIMEKTPLANRILFCDTDLITTQIYSRQYLGVVPEILLSLERKVTFDQYFLFDIDVPWIADGLRDLGTRREEMFTVFKNELVKRGIAFQLVTGNFEEREKLIRKSIDKLLAIRE